MNESVAKFHSWLSAKQKYTVTSIICYCNFMLGLTSLYSTFAVNYILRYDSFQDLSDAIWIGHSISQAAYVIGPFLYLLTSKKIDRHRNAIAYLCLSALPLFILPFSGHRGPLYVLLAWAGLGLGAFDAAQTAWIINMWGPTKCAPFLMARFLFYPVGGRISSDYFFDLGNANLDLAFIVSGVLVCTGVAALVALYFYLGRKTHNSAVGQEIMDSLDHQNHIGIAGKLESLSVVFILVYHVIEELNMGYAPYFAYENYDLWNDMSLAASITYAVTRGFGIIVVLRVASEYVLAANSVVIIAGTLCVLFVGSAAFVKLMGVALLGFGCSLIFPAFLIYIQKYLVINDRRAALFTASARVIAFVFVVTKFGEEIYENPRIINYVTFGLLPVTAGTFAVVYYFTAYKGKNVQNANGV